MKDILSSLLTWSSLVCNLAQDNVPSTIKKGSHWSPVRVTRVDFLRSFISFDLIFEESCGCSYVACIANSLQLFWEITSVFSHDETALNHQIRRNEICNQNQQPLAKFPKPWDKTGTALVNEKKLDSTLSKSRPKLQSRSLRIHNLTSDYHKTHLWDRLNDPSQEIGRMIYVGLISPFMLTVKPFLVS